LLARFVSNPGAAHIAALHHLLGYLSCTKHRVLRFAPNNEEVVVFSDASWATQNSVSGGVILYKGCPVQWWSRRQKSVSASTAEAECFAAALATRECVYVRDLLDDLGFGVTQPTPLLLDSKSALDLAMDSVVLSRKQSTFCGMRMSCATGWLVCCMNRVMFPALSSWRIFLLNPYVLAYTRRC
jgi:hypothetical protein